MKAGSIALSSPYRQSSEKVFIGNRGLGKIDYYVGAISEVSINNGVRSDAEISATWEQIKGNIEY